MTSAKGLSRRPTSKYDAVMASTPRFIHLRLHTEYSLLEGAVRLKQLPELCLSAELPAVAITDTNNCFAALEASLTLAKAGIQPIIGAQLSLEYGPDDPSARQPTLAYVVVLVQNAQGYANLLKLNSCLYLARPGAAGRH